MSVWNIYHVARNIPEALQVLSSAPGPARLISGGTDFLLDLQQGRHPPLHTLVDVTALPEANAIEIRQDSLFIGASVPLNKIILSPLVQEHAQGVVEACSLIGGPQVRNTATLGGNVAHALPAADGTIALLAQGATAEIANLQGLYRRPLIELFAGPGVSTLDPHAEILVGFYLPLRKTAQASIHRRVMRPQGVAIAILNMAVWIERQAEVIGDIRIAVGPAGPTPQRATQAEALLRGQTVDEHAVSAAFDALMAQVKFRTSPHRATSDYRCYIAGVLLEDTMRTAWQRTF